MKLTAFLLQGSSALSIAYLTSLSGFVFAWPSYTISIFASNETVLSTPMSTLEVSLLGSLPSFGALATTPFCGYALNTFGRKYSAMFFGIPFVLAWSIISLTSYVPLVLASMCLAGIGAAGQTVSSVYISEICQDSIRGALTNTTITGYYLGLLLSYYLGGNLSYHQILYVHLTMSVMYIVFLTLLKESPVYLLQQGKEKEAAKSISFYRRIDITSNDVEVEIRKIKLQLDPRIETLMQRGNDVTAAEELLQIELNDELTQDKSAWKIMLKSESTKRALFTCLAIVCLSIMMGSIVLQVYSESLFKEAVPSMGANQCSIFLAIDFLIASSLCAVLVDRLGRMFLMIFTCIGSGICMLLLGIQLIFYWAPHWFTAVLIYMYGFIYNLGASSVPYILIAEVFLPEVRGLCNSICMTFAWIATFVALVIFNPLVESFGLGLVFCGFSSVAFLVALYCYIYLPETKNLPADAIQYLFLKKKQ